MANGSKHGKSKTGFSDAVKDALKDVDSGKWKITEQTVDFSPNPGTINFIVRLDPASG
jgi:hypothetical protein